MMLHLVNVPFEYAISIALYLLLVLLATIYFPYKQIKWLAVLSYAVVAIAWRLDLAIPVGLAVSSVFLVIFIIKDAYRKSKNRFGLAVFIGLIAGFLLWLIIFH